MTLALGGKDRVDPESSLASQLSSDGKLLAWERPWLQSCLGFPVCLQAHAPTHTTIWMKERERAHKHILCLELYKS